MNAKNMIKINKLAASFRQAIEKARDEGAFSDDFSFRHFPRGCCGDASDLLAQYLMEYGIQTWYICGTHRPAGETEIENWNGIQSHAWLATADPRQTDQYLIIDITGDQFKFDPEYGRFDKPVYIGKMDWFHRLFEVEEVWKCKELSTLALAAARLEELYRIIVERIKYC
jgi:hypothetical protein